MIFSKCLYFLFIILFSQFIIIILRIIFVLLGQLIIFKIYDYILNKIMFYIKLLL
jgi:hypothetical protein